MDDDDYCDFGYGYGYGSCCYGCDGESALYLIPLYEVYRLYDAGVALTPHFPVILTVIIILSFMSRIIAIVFFTLLTIAGSWLILTTFDTMVGWLIGFFFMLGSHAWIYKDIHET